MALFDILKQYTDPQSAPAESNVLDHFDQVAQQAPREDLGRGLAAAFRADSTPPFEQTVGDLFHRSNPDQRAGVLNELIRSIGPGALSGIAGGVLGRMFGGGGAGTGSVPTVTPAQASQLSPSDVSAIAAHAHAQDGSVVDKVAAFYAEHPTLVKSMGAAALAIALGRMHSSN